MITIKEQYLLFISNWFILNYITFFLVINEKYLGKNDQSKYGKKHHHNEKAHVGPLSVPDIQKFLLAATAGTHFRGLIWFS